MSDHPSPQREPVTIIRDSNGPLYVLVALLVVAGVGVAYWVSTSRWHRGPAPTTTVIMPAPAPAGGPDVWPDNRQIPDNRPRDSAPPAATSEPTVLVPKQ